MQVVDERESGVLDPYAPASAVINPRHQSSPRRKGPTAASTRSLVSSNDHSLSSLKFLCHLFEKAERETSGMAEEM